MKNLTQWNPKINHDLFIQSVIKRFTELYNGDGKVIFVDRPSSEEGEEMGGEYVKEVERELKSWEWQFGQTPEFTNLLSGIFDDELVVSAELTFSLDQFEMGSWGKERKRLS